MFDIRLQEDGTVQLSGRLDASQAETARVVFESITDSTTVDFEHLAYISSAGLGVLIATQRRLADAGHEIKIRNLNRHLAELFDIAGFPEIFDIE